MSDIGLDREEAIGELIEELASTKLYVKHGEDCDERTALGSRAKRVIEQLRAERDEARKIAAAYADKYGMVALPWEQQ